MRHKKKNGWLSAAAGICVFVAAAVWVIQGVRQTGASSGEEGRRLAEQAVRRAAVSCYAVEGAYPESYAYLKEHYGTMVDEQTYAVFYEVFASNIMPEITVVQIGGQS